MTSRPPAGGPEDVATQIASAMPRHDIARLATATGEGPQAVSSLRSSAGSPAIRSACDQITRLLESHPGDFVAGCLAGAAAAVEKARHAQQIDVVWTGPSSGIDTARLTAGVVAELIGEAQRRILLVSYATFPDRRVLGALAAAVARGVDITVVYERGADNSAYRSDVEAFAGLGVRRVVWPADQRPPGAALHPKLIVVDDQTALVGSANLTGRALDINIECGVLIRGGPQPKAITEHIFSLIHTGALLVLHTRS
ncbi:MAG: DISARM system phospholipase D-like protein DrmC [Acidimicrobiales bacterium]